MEPVKSTFDLLKEYVFGKATEEMEFEQAMIYRNRHRIGHKLGATVTGELQNTNIWSWVGPIWMG